MPEISQEELDLFNKYKELGEPDTISNELNAKASLERENVLQEVAAVSGFKSSVLAKLSEGLDLKVEDGVAYVGDVPIADYANEQWEEFLPSLKEEKKPTGISFVRQATKSSDSKVKLGDVNAYLKGIYGSKQTVN